MIIKDALRVYRTMQGLFTRDERIQGIDLPTSSPIETNEAIEPIRFEGLPTPRLGLQDHLGTKIDIIV